MKEGTVMIVDRDIHCPECEANGRKTFLMHAVVADHAVLRVICRRCQEHVVVTIKHASIITCVEGRSTRTIVGAIMTN